MGNKAGKIHRGPAKGTPSHKKMPVGSETVRTWHGVQYKYRKTEEGWKQVERLTPYKNGEMPDRHPKAKVKKDKYNGRPARSPQPEIKRLPDRSVDPSSVKSVKVSRNTWIVVPKEMDEQSAIDNWYKKHNV